MYYNHKHAYIIIYVDKWQTFESNAVQFLAFISWTLSFPEQYLCLQAIHNYTYAIVNNIGNRKWKWCYATNLV